MNYTEAYMLKFGDYAVVSDVKHVFEKAPALWWVIRPPTSKDELEVAKLMSTDRTRMEPDGTRVNVSVTALEIAMKEISVTFGGTNIPTSESDPAPILAGNAALAQVEDVVSRLPREVIAELWVAVGKAVPGWGPMTKPGDAKN